MVGLFDGNKKSKKMFGDMLEDIDESEKKKPAKKKKDFYGEEDNFSDLDKPVGGYYGESKKNKTKKKSHRIVLDYEWWEVIIFVIEILLITYAVLVFLGIVPLF